jgi:hypothetical protein
LKAARKRGGLEITPFFYCASLNLLIPLIPEITVDSGQKFFKTDLKSTHMSIIVALISTRDGVVASDGRHFGSASLENGKIVQPAIVTSAEFDKTFSLDSGKLIGAFAGLMSFSGKNIGQHIAEIIANSVDGKDCSIITVTIEQEMKRRLARINDREVSFDQRKLDILLVVGENLTRRQLKIASLRFIPDNGIVSSQKEIVSAEQFNRYYVHGEDKAKVAATRIFKQNSAPNRDPKFLRSLAIRAVEAGIRAAGSHSYGSERACGGKVFTKSTAYK